MNSIEQTGMHQGACTCPVCCPSKWDMNAAAARHALAGSQTGFYSQGNLPSPQETVNGMILARLERIEAILTAHFKPREVRYPHRCPDCGMLLPGPGGHACTPR
jgi:hypothetical protein